MPIAVTELHDKRETAAEMCRLAETYAADLAMFDLGDGRTLADLTLPEYYAAIRAIPYRQDVTGVEVVSRPYLMFAEPGSGWDCKKKAIAIAAWLKLHFIPYRFVAVSSRPAGEIHHVVVQAWIDNEWCEIDATYQHNQLFGRQEWTAVESLGGDGPIPGAPILVSLSGNGDPSLLLGDYRNAVRGISPEYLGGLSAAAGAVIAAAIAAVATVTIAVISAVSNKRDRERATKVQAQTVRSYAEIAAQNQAQAETAAMEQQLRMEATIKQWVLPGSIALAAILFLGGKS